MIYCVEDERNIRELLIYTLETTGFKARGFGNGNELMKALKEEIPELILLDIMLPGDDGYTILEQLKSMPSVKDVPVIMVTAKEAEFDKVKGLEGGADDYITKPFGMMEFVARVKAVLRRSARQNEDKELHYDELYLNVGRHEVHYREEKVDLMKIRIGNDYNSDRYLAYTDMGLNDWMICYVIPVSEAQKSYNFVRKYELIFTIGFCVMVSMLFLWGFVKNRSKNKQLIQAAETDALTSAYNKRSTEERIHNVLQEHPQEPGTFVIMDVDHFKEVNDIYGHITGDKVLHKFGEVLYEHFREGDIVGRIGGDEFVVFMRKTDSREVAVSRIESLIKKVKELTFPEMNGKNITISAGMAFAPEHGTGYLDLYKNADTALYKTKQNGRDGYNIYEEEKR